MAAAKRLHIDNVDWKGGTKSTTIGKDSIAARYAEGTGTYNGDAASYSYATLNVPGAAKQILIIYAVTHAMGPARKQEAKDCLNSIQKIN